MPNKAVSLLSIGRNICAGVYNIAVNANKHLPLQQKHITPSSAKSACNCKTPMVAAIIKTQTPADYTVQVKNFNRLSFASNISLTTENFKMTFYTPIACSYLRKITWFYSSM